MTNLHQELRNKLDVIAEHIGETKEHLDKQASAAGERIDLAERLSQEHEALHKELQSAAAKGDVLNTLRYEFAVDLDQLLTRVRSWEKDLYSDT